MQILWQWYFVWIIQSLYKALAFNN